MRILTGQKTTLSHLWVSISFTHTDNNAQKNSDLTPTRLEHRRHQSLCLWQQCNTYSETSIYVHTVSSACVHITGIAQQYTSLSPQLFIQVYRLKWPRTKPSHNRLLGSCTNWLAIMILITIKGPGQKGWELDKYFPTSFQPIYYPLIQKDHGKRNFK